jgi:voltage-dependent potassium channel beta subunit
MEYRRLGCAGIRLSALSLGGWATYGEHVDESLGRAIILSAHEAGINFFDTAETYGNGKSETAMGKVLNELPRDTYVLSTKLFWGGELPNQYGLSRKHLTDGLHASLKRLGHDYVDLLYCHRPDPDTPIAETVWAMHNFILQGKVLYWGTSEWSAQQITEAYAIAQQHHLTAPQMEQPLYNMFNRERIEKEYLPLYQLVGLGTTIYSPLAQGALTGKYTLGGKKKPRTRTGFEEQWFRSRQLTPDREARIKKLARVASDLNCSLGQLALAWCIRNPNVSSVITGATKIEQLHENVKAVDIVAKLTPAIMERIDGILENKPS